MNFFNSINTIQLVLSCTNLHILYILKLLLGYYNRYN